MSGFPYRRTNRAPLPPDHPLGLRVADLGVVAWSSEACGSWRLIGCDRYGAQDARQALRVGHLQIREITGPEPAKIVVLLGCGVDGFSVPARNEKCVHVEGRIADRHRDGHGIVDVDPEFFEAFPTDGLVRQLIGLDMSAGGKAPAVRIPPTRWMAMREEHETVAHKYSDRDRDLGNHGRHSRCEHPSRAPDLLRR